MKTWLRLYTEVLNDPKVQRLPGEIFKAWVNLLCIAKEADQAGVLPGIEDMAFMLRMDKGKLERIMAKLVQCNLIDTTDNTYRLHGWTARQYESDADKTALDRKRRERAKAKQKNVTRDNSVTSRVTSDECHANVTPTDTDTDTDTDIEKTQERAREIPKPLPPARILGNQGRYRAALVDPIRKSFMHYNPEGFTDEAREQKAVLGLAEKFARLGGADPVAYALVVLARFRELTQGADNFWSRQPFTPSTLDKPGIFDRVVQEAKARAGKAGPSPSRWESLEHEEVMV